MVIRFTAEAEADLIKARRWYSHQRQDLALEFMECIEDVLYQVTTDEIRVFAVFHSRRDPNVWQSRVH